MSIKLLAITTLLVCLAMTKSLLPTFAIKTVTATTANSATNSAKADLRLLLAGRGVGLEGKEEVMHCEERSVEVGVWYFVIALRTL